MELRWPKSARCPPPSGYAFLAPPVKTGQQPLASPSIHRAGVQEGVHTPLTVPHLVSSSSLCHHSGDDSLAFPSVPHRDGHARAHRDGHARAHSAQALEGNFQGPQDSHLDLARGPRPCCLTLRGLPPGHPQSLAGCGLLKLFLLWQAQLLSAGLLPPPLAARASPFFRPHRYCRAHALGCLRVHPLLLDTAVEKWRLRVSQPCFPVPSTGLATGGAHWGFAK